MVVLSESKASSTIYLGRLVKPFGIKGELKFVASDDFWTDVLRSKKLVLYRQADKTIEKRPVVIERSREHGNNYVVKIKGIDDRNGAESEVGSELFVDTGQLDVSLPDRELPFQIVGSTVKTEEGRILGEIVSVQFSAAHPVYEVEGEDGAVLIPAVPEFIIDRNEDNGEITIRTIPGLLDE